MTYKTILLKLSGEALSGKNSIYDQEILNSIFKQAKFLVQEKQVKLSIVIGGGNIWRGELSKKMDIEPEKADYMGMLATSINAIALCSFFNKNGLKSIFINSLSIENVANNATPDELKNYLLNGYIIIFGGGTGKPFFSTDTAASIRAKEIEADVIYIAKNNVDGVYDKDPNIFHNAIFFPKISFDEIINKKLKIVDHSSLEILRGTGIELLIFNMNRKNFIESLYNNNIDGNLKTIVYEK